MPRRIEVELTSKVDDETWTWRAAGAKQPRGTLAAKLLPEDARVGDVLRAEVENDIDGIAVLAILPSKEKTPEPERIVILPPSERPRPSPAPRPERERPPRDRARTRPERPRPERAGRPPRAERPKPEPPPERPKPKRLNPGHVHRNAVMKALPPEKKPIAEQLLRGGLPAVRQAIEAQNEVLKAENQPTITPGPLLALAEELLPSLKAAEWRDRAEAASAAGDDLSLRDLRSVVTSAEAARDDESRLLARSLRETLDRRLKAERESWLGEIEGALTSNRVVRALRIASRPPDTAMRFPGELGAKLAEAASTAMNKDAAPDRWLAVLDAVSVSPVRRAIQPHALPADAPDDFVATVKKAVSRVPGVGPLVGIEPPAAPPPPPPPKPPMPKPLPRRQPPGAAAPEPEPRTETSEPATPPVPADPQVPAESADTEEHGEARATELASEPRGS